MGVQLAHVLAGIAARRVHHNAHGLVQHLIAVHHTAQHQAVAFKGRPLLNREKHLLKQAHGSLAAHAHNGYAAFARSRSQANDGILHAAASKGPDAFASRP